ncbi:MAG: hypothetical protein HQK52_17910 [Oligoflexia bacterium]|nr:hypothetical protein [Oligoflexia bacterium]
MPKKSKKLEGALNVDKGFIPCSIAEGDEIYRNGLFHFNIIKMLQFIHQDEGKTITLEII